MKQIEKAISSEKRFKGRIVNLRHDEIILDNHIYLREVVEHPGGVCVLALTKDHHVIMVEQYRYAAAQLMTELPAGKKEKNEEPMVTAQRELLEETGYVAKQWVDYGVFYPSPAYLDEVIHLYVAKELEFVGQKLDQGEYLDVHFVPLSMLMEKIVSGEYTDGKTIALASRYYLNEKEGLK